MNPKPLKLTGLDVFMGVWVIMSAGTVNGHTTAPCKGHQYNKAINDNKDKAVK